MRARLRVAFAVVQPGLVDLLADELRSLGVDATKTDGGVSFPASIRALHRVHLFARLPTRVWIRLGAFRATALDALARGVQGLEWAAFLRPRQPVDVKVAIHHSRLRFRDRVARKVEHAIRDALRSGRRPAPRRRGPPPEPARVLVRIDHDEVEVSVDATGEPLYRRGWRRDVSAAPLRENLAAAVLEAVGWQPGEPLVDPMCGSGTLCIEAATRATQRAPGARRRFAFESWPDHDVAAWAAAQRAIPAPRAAGGPIWGFDRNGRVLDAARANGRRAGVGDAVAWSVRDVRDLDAPAPRGAVVVNPPWGGRLDKAEPAWRALGETLRTRFSGWRVAVLSPRSSLTARLGFPTTPTVNFPAGGIRISVCTGNVPEP